DKKKSPARNLIETVLVVGVLVLVLRGFLLEAFKIPSSSMEPTLLGHPYHGDRVLAFKPSVTIGTPARWSVVVFLKRPDRLERSKGETTSRNFIKRVVGVPGDRLMLTGGDVFVEGAESDDYSIARKPPSVQEEVWHPVYDSRHDRDRKGAPPWKLDGGLAHDFEKGTISSRSEGTAWARFAVNHHEDDGGLVTNLYVKRLRIGIVCPGCGREFKADIGTTRTRVGCPGCGRAIDVLADPPAAEPTEPAAPDEVERTRFRVWVGCTDCPDALEAPLPGLRRQVPCPRCGKPITPACYPVRREGEVPVADVRVSFDVRSSAGRGWVLAELSVDDDRYVARVPLGGGKASVSGPASVGSVESAAPVPTFASARSATAAGEDAPGEARRVSFAKVDQALVLRVDGEEIIRKEYDLDWRKRVGRPTSNSVRIGIEGARAAFARVLIERDLHYLPRGNPELYDFYSVARERWTGEPRSGEGGAIRMRERLGESQFVMLGDNSPSSYDGRMWPPVEKGDMVGRAFFLFWPPSRMRRVR
ncbi:MAG: signal peptidase I, partial [Planctomycetota bacterium]